MAGPLVVGYDGTEGAKAALVEALRLAGALGVDIVVAFAYWAGPLGGEGADLLATLRERGRAVTEEALETARVAGVQGSAELVNDRPAEALAQVAEEVGAQMIAVGSYGERPLTALIVGSTPHRLMHVTAVPVLVVRGVPPAS
jgi:nucleotide-binding universal stress UspA family protein